MGDNICNMSISCKSDFFRASLHNAYNANCVHEFSVVAYFFLITDGMTCLSMKFLLFL